MTEREFWTALEFRVSREIASFRDNKLRFLFCDGFIPDDDQPNDHVIAGDAFISGDDRTHSRYRFRSFVPPSGPEGPRWDSLLPADEHHDWLTVDRDEQWIEMRLR
jgi:hypothetical protein